jgi:uncharacterized protein (DUF2147 family)
MVLSPVKGGKYSLEVETQTPNFSLEGYSPEITHVTAFIYNTSGGEETYYGTVSLIKGEGGTYSGEIEVTENGNYNITIRIRDNIGNLEFRRNVETISFKKSVPAWEFTILIVSLLGLILLKKTRIIRR